MKTWDDLRKIEGDCPQSIAYINALEELYNLDLIHEIKFWSYQYKSNKQLARYLLNYFHTLRID